jgi:aspartyl-tRNA(Asn)/glutamyl-tRNA(Gln) amidotransferase subunit B
MMGEIQAKLNKSLLTIDEVQISPAVLAGLIKRVRDETITNKAAREVLEEIWNSQRWTVTADMTQSYSAKGSETISADTAAVDAVIEAKGLKSMNDAGALEKIIDDVLAANAKNVAEFKAGNAKAFNALVGQAMKATQGKANPAQVNELLKKKLG